MMFRFVFLLRVPRVESSSHLLKVSSLEFHVY